MRLRSWICTFALLALAASTRAAPLSLLQAVKTGNHAAALAMLAHKAPASAADPDGTTALHWAVRQNDIELAKRLLDVGADPSAANRYGVTPLYLAAQNGSAEMISALLDAGANPNQTGNLGETVLMTAARTGVVDAAEALLRHGAAVDAREQWHGQTALMWAAAEDHAAMAALLLKHGADPNARSNIKQWQRQYTAEPRAKWLPPGGMTPLLFAARDGCLDCVSVLVKAGADVNMTTPDGISPLVSALINGHYDVAAALIDAGADANIVDYTGRGPLYAAVDFDTMPKSNRPAPQVVGNRHTAFDLIKMLLDHGANPNAQLTRQAPYRAKLDRGNDTVLNKGTTPLLRAAKAGDIAAMRVLLAHSADPKLSTKDGVNPLMVAAGLGTTEQDTTGRYKTEDQAIAAIEMLLSKGLDVNAVDSRGRTALHGAALQGYDKVVRALVAHGARLDIKDNKGFTALDVAMGRAGGWGFAGKVGVVQKSTATLLRQLMARDANVPDSP